MKAVIYLRVSSEEQANTGLGIAAQRNACADYCRRKGYEVVGVCMDEGVSGGTLDRPGLMSALSLHDAGAVVVIYSLSRLTRRMADLLELVDNRAQKLRVESATETFDTTSAAGRMMMTMFGAFAEMERTLASERTKAALASKKARGEKLGPRYMEDKNPGVVERIIALRQTGLSAVRIAHLLNTEQVPTVNGGRKWHEATIRKVLKRHGGVQPGGDYLEQAGAEGGGEAPAGAAGDCPEEQGRPAEEDLALPGGDAGEDASGAVQ